MTALSFFVNICDQENGSFNNRLMIDDELNNIFQ